MSVRSRLRQAPPLARRDRIIAELRRERDELRASHGAPGERNALMSFEDFGKKVDKTPSYYIRYKMLRRVHARGKSVGHPHPIWSLDTKQEGYSFAQAHGYAVPATLGEYAHVSELPWNDLPDHFVIKTHRGAMARGVVPLSRVDGKYLDLLAERRGPQAPDDVIAHLEKIEATGKISRELTIEELLKSPHHSEPTLTPDIKMYCFYGTVGLIMVRMTNGSRRPQNFRVRYFDADGVDQGDAMPFRNADPDVPAPLHLEDLVSAGARLSVAVRVPFVRVDFYETADSIVFGEITPAPGGPQLPRPDVDRRLGQLWEDAEVRLLRDLAEAGAIQPQLP